MAEQHNLSLFITTPSIHGSFSTEYVTTVVSIINLAGKEGIPVQWYPLAGNSILPVARNRCIHNFMQSGFSHALLLDADVGLSPKDVIDCMKSGLKFTALPYCKRTFSKDKSVQNIVKYADSGAMAFHAGMSPGAFKLSEDQESAPKEIRELGFAQADSTATGAMIINRKVFLEFQKGHPDRRYKEHYGGPDEDVFEYFRYSRDKDQYFVGEDWTFCKDWRELGGKIWLKLDAKTAHSTHFPMIWDGDLSIKMLNEGWTIE